MATTAATTDRSKLITRKIESSYDSHAQITGANVKLPNKRSGKVRDQYLLNSNTIALVTTDRQSGFDRMLALVPFKGQVRVVNFVNILR
jgi:phosphoribosylaminoimidazole-succinocarboxamide synthase